MLLGSTGDMLMGCRESKHTLLSGRWLLTDCYDHQTFSRLAPRFERVTGSSLEGPIAKE